MTREDLIAKLSTWIGEITELPAPPLAESTDLVEDLGLDSLALAELAARLRRGLGIKLRPGELRTDLRVAAVVDVAMARLAEGAKN